ncbi:hypothetical protein JTE90_012376 [Oedothorax gibbosus]|uniref:Uncharacterized protein n=1 Tax=Oedothorax gibbosus TaxID=931172 RepID=A0AAV6TDI2_9ARAC|nr:hypothetical protein JTE90_012376 [Oedothorax gibbosus]
MRPHERCFCSGTVGDGQEVGNSLRSGKTLTTEATSLKREGRSSFLGYTGRRQSFPVEVYAQYGLRKPGAIDPFDFSSFLKRWAESYQGYGSWQPRKPAPYEEPQVGHLVYCFGERPVCEATIRGL